MQPTPDSKKAKSKSRLKKAFMVFLVMSLIFAFTILIFLYQMFGLTPSTIIKIVQNDFSSLKNTDGRINVLLLGIGGENHEGGDLTDTIMVVSTSHSKNDTLFTSIPRDLWIPELEDKINSAYTYAEKKSEGSGTEYVKALISNITGQPIHYALILDFGGFVKIIDLVGGVEVNVEYSFIDPLYPIAGKENDECGGDPKYLCRYETLKFEKGIELMNGERALKYVRSRHAEGDVGTDFSRSTRQQAVLSALKSKLLHQGVYTNVSLMQKLVAQMRDSLKGDMEFADLALFTKAYSLVTNPPRTANLTQELKDAPGLLINPPTTKYQGKWVLTPKNEDYSQIQKYLECKLKIEEPCESILD